LPVYFFRNCFHLILDPLNLGFQTIS
jgi:hypothetical protein